MAPSPGPDLTTPDNVKTEERTPDKRIHKIRRALQEIRKMRIRPGFSRHRPRPAEARIWASMNCRSRKPVLMHAIYTYITSGPVRIVIGHIQVQTCVEPYSVILFNAKRCSLGISF